MMSKKRRGLRPEEEALWRLVIQRAQPLFPDKKHIEQGTIGAPSRLPKDIAPLPRFRIGQTASATPSHWSARPVSTISAPLLMDHKTYAKMKRGKLGPEARIDLHGLIVAQAHPALMQFVLSAHAAHKRLVLVITGKGKPGSGDGPIPAREGVLRHQVPLWLNTPPLAAIILEVAQAHLKHGGSGAYYVYLRR